MKLPALPLATYTQVRQGETVFAFGSPGGLRNTLTHGLVSAVARQTDPDSPLIYVQTDAPINPGNSGGPLVNIRGEVVGVNTFIMSQSGGNEGLGFAIPTRDGAHGLPSAQAVRAVAAAGSRHEPADDHAGDGGRPGASPAIHGVIVSDVWPGGPGGSGRAAGSATSCVSVDGQPAENLPTVNYFFRLRDSDRARRTGGAGAAQTEYSCQRHRRRAEQRVRLGVGDARCREEPRRGARHPRRRDRSALAAGAKGLRDPYGIIVAARAAGAVDEVPLLPRDVIRSLNNEKTASLVGLRRMLRSSSPARR